MSTRSCEDVLDAVECECTASCSATTTTLCLRSTPSRARGTAGRGRHRHDQLHVRHHGAAEGRAADAPQHLAQRHRVRLARRRQRPRRLPAHAADVPLQRLGHALRASPAWAPSTSSSARSTAPRSCAASSEHGVTLMCGAPRPSSTRSLDAAADVGRRDPGSRPGPHRRRRRPAADAHHRAGRDRARLGVHPDLRPHRDVARC